jgi:hypothetical protein
MIDKVSGYRAQGAGRKVEIGPWKDFFLAPCALSLEPISYIHSGSLLRFIMRFTGKQLSEGSYDYISKG